jgi:RNA polymerase sigma-70 factor (ECF subfamily)
VIDDLIQETYLKLCSDRDRILREFQPAHKDAIYGYIKVFTANLVHDHFKSQRSQKRGHSLTTSFDAQPEQCRTGASSSGTGAVERKLLMNEVDECLKKSVAGPNADRDRRIFWLYYRVGLTANAIAALPDMGLGIKGIETTIFRLSRQVRLELTKPKRVPAEKETEGIRPSQSLYEAGNGE